MILDERAAERKQKGEPEIVGGGWVKHTLAPNTYTTVPSSLTTQLYEARHWETKLAMSTQSKRVKREWLGIRVHPVTPALRKLRQEEHKLKASLGYVERLSQQNQSKNKQQRPLSHAKGAQSRPATSSLI